MALPSYQERIGMTFERLNRHERRRLNAIAKKRGITSFEQFCIENPGRETKQPRESLHISHGRIIVRNEGVTVCSNF